jgi:hypothetical protein
LAHPAIAGPGSDSATSGFQRLFNKVSALHNDREFGAIRRQQADVFQWISIDEKQIRLFKQPLYLPSFAS